MTNMLISKQMVSNLKAVIDCYINLISGYDRNSKAYIDAFIILTKLSERLDNLEEAPTI